MCHNYWLTGIYSSSHASHSLETLLHVCSSSVKAIPYQYRIMPGFSFSKKCFFLMHERNWRSMIEDMASQNIHTELPGGIYIILVIRCLCCETYMGFAFNYDDVWQGNFLFLNYGFAWWQLDGGMQWLHSCGILIHGWRTWGTPRCSFCP